MALQENRWPTGIKTCSIPKEVTDVKHVLMLNIPKSLYGQSSISFDQITDATPGREWKIIFHAFLELAERARNAKTRPPPAHVPPADSAALESDDEDSDSEGGDDDFMDDDGVSDVDLGQNDGDVPLDADEDAHLFEGDEDPLPIPPPIVPPPPAAYSDHLKGDRPVDLFLEFVRAKPNARGTEEYTDYALFLVIYENAAADVNKLLEGIVNTGIRYSKLAAKSRDSAPKREVYEDWRTIESTARWAKLLDVYTHTTHDQRQEDAINMRLSDPKNPACAINFFSVPNGFRRRDPVRARRPQSLWDEKKYFHYEGVGRTKKTKLTFPARKFVHRALLSNIEAKILFNRLLPEYQMKSMTQLSQIFPLLLQDVHVTRVMDFKENLDTLEPPGENIEDCDVGDRVVLRNDGNASSDEDEDDPMMSALYNASDGVSAPRSRRTRGEAVEHMFGKWDIPFYDPEDGGAPLDVADLDRQRSNVMKRMLRMDDEEANAICGGVYGYLRSIALQYQARIRRDLVDPEANKYIGKRRNPVLVARKLYLLVQDLIIDEYSNRCRGQFDNLSPAGKQIIEHVKSESLYDNYSVHPKFDSSLCRFANDECRRYALFDQVYYVNDAHRVVSLADKCALDAYDMDFGRTHLHMMTTSEGGGLSKSLAWLILSEFIRIPKTVTMLTYHTAASRATETLNMNDGVICYDETSQRMIDKNDKGGTDDERKFKELLSRNKVQIMTFFKDPITGKRLTKITYAEWITVFFCSNNLPGLLTNIMSTAMQRRWHVIQMNEKPGKNRAISEMKLLEILKNANENTHRCEIDKEFHRMQALFFETSKLIFAGGLMPPSMHVASIMLLFISMYISDRGYPEPTVSQLERMIALARINVIRDAINRTFFQVGSKYAGARIEVENLKDLDRLLFCSVKHIVSAIGEASDVLMDTLEVNIRQSLMRVHQKLSSRTPKMYDYTVNRERSERLGQPVFEDNPSYFKFSLKKGGLKGLSHEIKGDMETNKCDTIPCADTIEHRLKLWTKRRITASTWEFVTPHRREGQRIVERELLPIDGTEEECYAAKYEYDSMRSKYYIHYEFITDPDMKKASDLLRAAILDVLSKRFQVAQRLVFAPRTDVPKVLEIIDIPQAAHDAPLLVIPQPTQIGSAEKKILKDLVKYIDESRKHELIVIPTDLDTYGLNERNKTLFITTARVDPESLNENPLGFINDEEEEDFDDANSRDGDEGDEDDEYGDDDEYDSGVERRREERESRRREERGNAARDVGDLESEEYDEKVGYFGGKDLRKLFTNSGRRAMAQFTPEKFEKIYDKLDEEENGCYEGVHDSDFNIEEYIVGRDPHTEDPIYHWDVLAQEVDAEDFEARSPSLPNFCKPSRRSLSRLRHDEADRVEEMMRAYNIGRYKLMCVHPLLEDYRINMTYYSTEAAKEDLIKYPGDMMQSLSVTRAQRWKDARNYTGFDSVKAQMKIDRNKCRIIGYRYDAANDNFEFEGDNSINSMDVVFEHADRAQRVYDVEDRVDDELEEDEHLQFRRRVEKPPQKKRKHPTDSCPPDQFLIDENSSSPVYPEDNSRSKRAKSALKVQTKTMSGFEGLSEEFWTASPFASL